MNQPELAAYVAGLARDPAAFITFVEAQTLVAQLATARALTSATAAELALLLAHPRLTLGAARLLREPVSRLRERVADEWRAGQAAVGPSQDQAQVRVAPGQELAVVLPEAGVGQAHWRLEHVAGPIEVTLTRHYPPPPEQPEQAGCFRLEARGLELGLGRLDLSLHQAERGDQPRREYVLYVVIDSPPVAGQ